MAEKIFFKLLGTFPQDESIQTFVKTHANEAITELALVDRQLMQASKSPDHTQLNISSVSQHQEAPHFEKQV